ncbi:hypothetical protein [Anabaena subtropica]|uniref:Uncharacterized protein n=1 Tax=Anabaena subtropica FACHB-260 TaxID=2692884 RepID=A0ABR8CKA6_9NOST|nr:hypothetical protein [Anabaena subtropica]MBD2342935.1 hypothetical protein [Anabaena subtropica FACHB-260]
MQNRTQATDSLQTPDVNGSIFSNDVSLKNGNQPRDAIQFKSRDLLNKFVSSVQVLVDDITALEVNTMVVSNITGAKFSAWEAYQEIYSIQDKDYFNVNKIPEDISLRERYQGLFSQLEREYFYIIIEHEQLHNEKVAQYHQRLQFLKEIKKGNIVESDPRYMELARPILPAPTPVLDGVNLEDQNENWKQTWEQNHREIQTLLSNDKFVRTLRKVAELKAALDGGDVTNIKTDTIYAQTVMQLDGDIITRYHKDLFSLPEETKSLILQVHNEGVVAGEKQWHGVLDFVINLVRSLANLSLNGRR